MTRNRPLRPGEQPPLAGPNAGNKGGNNRNRNNGGGNNRNRNRGGGGGAGTDTTTAGFDFSGIAADPGAWLQGELQKVGYDPLGQGQYNAFLNSITAEPFAAGWDTYQTNNANQDVNIGSYIGTQGWGAPQANPDPNAAPDMSLFKQWLDAQISRYSPQQRGIYNTGKDRGGTRWSVYI